jgi:hypothetical protein
LPNGIVQQQIGMTGELMERVQVAAGSLGHFQRLGDFARRASSNVIEN